MVTYRASHQLGQILGFGLLLGFLAQVRLALLLHDLLVGFGGRHGQPLGQQEIAGVAGGDLHHLAAAAQSFDIFSQNDFHGALQLAALRSAPRTAAARCFAPS